MALVLAQATHLNVVPGNSIDHGNQHGQASVLTMDIWVAFRRNKGHGHQHRYDLQQDNRHRHDPQQQNRYHDGFRWHPRQRTCIWSLVLTLARDLIGFLYPNNRFLYHAVGQMNMYWKSKEPGFFGPKKLSGELSRPPEIKAREGAGQITWPK